MSRGKNLIKITTIACKKLATIASSENVPSIIFRIKGGGCNGFTYKFSPTNDVADKLDEVYCLKEKIKEMDDVNSPLESIHVCGKSLIHILGTEIDWKKDIMGETFVFNNPMAQSSCGCGTSFNSKKLI